MTSTATVWTTNQHGKQWRSRNDEDDVPSGCFGILRLRASSSSLRPQSRDRATPARPRTAVFDPSSAVPDAQGYPVSGKSAELLGLVPKVPQVSRTSSPVAWRSPSGLTAASTPSKRGPSSLRSQVSAISADEHISVQAWPKAGAAGNSIPDPLDAVRRRLRAENMTGTSVNRSSSAPASRPTRNYSRKWRKSTRLEITDVKVSPRHSGNTGKNFFDAASTIATPITEDEIPDTNKFDKLLTPQRKEELTEENLTGRSQHSSARIRSAAGLTFAWMELQQEMMAKDKDSVIEPRDSWLLLSDGTTESGKIAGAGKKRRNSVRFSTDSEDSFQNNDKRNTLEWMGVDPADIPKPIAAAAAA